MSSSRFPETLSPSLPCAFSLALVVFLPPGGAVRLAAVATLAGLSLTAFALGDRHRAAWRRLCAALAVGLALGTISHFRADALLITGGGGFSRRPDRVSPLCSPIGIKGLISSDARRTSRGLLQFDLSVQGILGADQAQVSASGQVTVFVRGPAPARGSEILVNCQPPQEIQASQRARIFVDPGDIKLLRQPSVLEAWRTGLRSGILAALGGAGAEAGPLLEALFLGVRDDLDSSLAKAFRDAGCAHILALSGQHVGILAALVALILGPLIGRSRAGPAACFLAAFYLVLVGPSPSVTRAILMFWVATILKAIDRPQKPGTVLALVFICTALGDPLSVRSLSFQLSYLAVAGIALFSPRIDFFFQRWIPPLVSGALAVGLASLGATAFLSILVFGRLNPFSPLVSALAGLLVGALMWLGAFLAPIVILFPGFQPIAALLFRLPYRLLSWLLTGAAGLPALEFPQGSVRGAASLAVALSCALVYALPYARYKLRHRRQARNSHGLFRHPIRASADPIRERVAIRGHIPHPYSLSSGLQLSQGSVGPPGNPGAGDAQEIRAEFSDQFQC